MEGTWQVVENESLKVLYYPGCTLYEKARHLDQTARVARAVHCFCLDYPRRHDELESLLCAVVEHAREVSTGS